MCVCVCSGTTYVQVFLRRPKCVIFRYYRGEGERTERLSVYSVLERTRVFTLETNGAAAVNKCVNKWKTFDCDGS